MEFDVPWDLIREAKSLRRKEAGLSSYDPDDSNLPNLPSLKESLAQFDPSPAELRCEHCKSRLIRGSDSIVCVYCGSFQNGEGSPEPIAFKSTVAYRWLLETLKLDESETVEVPIEENESLSWNRKSKDVTISELLDLEIKSPGDTVTFENGLLSQELLRSDSGGSDVDKFFNVREKSIVLENIHSSDTIAASSSTTGTPIDSGWQADFQQFDDPTSLDHPEGSVFVSSASIDVEKIENVMHMSSNRDEQTYGEAVGHSSSISSLDNNQLQPGSIDTLGQMRISDNHDYSSDGWDAFNYSISTDSKPVNDPLDGWDVFRDSIGTQNTSKNSFENSGEINAEPIGLFGHFQDSSGEKIVRSVYEEGDGEGTAAAHASNEGHAALIGETLLIGGKKMSDRENSLDALDAFKDPIGTQSMFDNLPLEIEESIEERDSLDVFGSFQDSSYAKDMSDVYKMEGDAEDTAAGHGPNASIGKTSVMNERMIEETSVMMDSKVTFDKNSLDASDLFKDPEERTSVDIFGSLEDPSDARVVWDVYMNQVDGEGTAVKYDINEDQHALIGMREKQMTDYDNFLGNWDIFKDSIDTRNMSGNNEQTNSEEHNSVDVFGPFQDSTEATAMLSGNIEGAAVGHDGVSDIWDALSGKAPVRENRERKMMSEKDSPMVCDLTSSRRMADNEKAVNENHDSLSDWGDFKDSTSEQNIPNGRCDHEQKKVNGSRVMFDGWDTFMPSSSSRETDVCEQIDHKGRESIDVWGAFQDSQSKSNIHVKEGVKEHDFSDIWDVFGRANDPLTSNITSSGDSAKIADWGSFKYPNRGQDTHNTPNKECEDDGMMIIDDNDSFEEWDVFQAASSAQNM